MASVQEGKLESSTGLQNDTPTEIKQNRYGVVKVAEDRRRVIEGLVVKGLLEYRGYDYAYNKHVYELTAQGRKYYGVL